MNFKNNIKKLGHSDNSFIRMIYWILKFVWFCFRLCMNGRIRAETFAGLFSGNSVHQLVTFTATNRYPLIFQKCAEYFVETNISDPKILSFGCSTGEEVFTLGKYLPHATIIGVDTNSWCIRECVKANQNSNYSFFNRNSASFEHSGDFDAIFCMAVFQRSENRTSKDNRIARGHTFSQFESEIKVLDGKLKVGGLFIIDHADFSFADTACAYSYKPLGFEKNQMVRIRPLYDRTNRKVTDQQENYRVFEKVSFTKSL